jgi:hypothetical protein
MASDRRHGNSLAVTRELESIDRCLVPGVAIQTFKARATRTGCAVRVYKVWQEKRTAGKFDNLLLLFFPFAVVNIDVAW